MSKRVSIVVPIYNQEKYLARCIDSVLKQTYGNIEVILVDDDSTDLSVKICEKYAAQNNNIKVYTKKNGGVSSSRNVGISKATGDFIFFLDADDAIEDGVIERLVESYSDGTLVSCRMKINRNGKSSLIMRKDLYKREEVMAAILKNEMQGFICGYLFPKNKIVGISFCEKTSYLEDVLFMADYLDKNPTDDLKFLPESAGCYVYYQSEASMTNKKSNIIGKLRNIEMALKILDEKTGMKYKQLSDNKKIELFYTELVKADKKTLEEAVNIFGFAGYDGNNRRMKIFSRYYLAKDTKRLFRYLRFCRLRSKIAKIIMV